MCLGVPGRVEDVWEADGTRMGLVDFGGVRRTVCLAYVPEIEVGDWAIVHVGFALTRLDEAAAAETLELLRQMEAPAADRADARGAGGQVAPGGGEG